MTDLNQTLLMLLVLAPGFIAAITLHEAAHAWAAKRLGDNTAAMLGRVTLNPIKHIDPMGTILIPGMLIFMGSPFLIGWAKPVPVNTRNLQRPSRDHATIAAAGPAANVALVAVFVLLSWLGVFLPSSVQAIWYYIMFFAIRINIVLAIFNMLPLPGLDGSWILMDILPPKLKVVYRSLFPHMIPILIFAVFLLPMLTKALGLPHLNILDTLIGTPTENMMQYLQSYIWRP